MEIRTILWWVDQIVLIYFLVVQLWGLTLLLLAMPHVYKRYREVRSENFTRILNSESIPQISIIVPAYNEESCIIFTIKSLLYLSYRYKEIIIINDGSSDSTLEILKTEFKLVPVPPSIPPVLKTQSIKQYYKSQLYPNLIIIDKEHGGGKVDCGNAGINMCTSPYYLMIDADTVISDQALQALMRPFLMKRNVLASGGSIGVANDCELQGNRLTKINFPKNVIAGIQVVEYLRAFLFGRIGWNDLGGSLIISGAFGLFDRDAVVKVGGYKLHIAEDIDLTIRLHKKFLYDKKEYIMDFVPDLVAMTEVPTSLSLLGKQRQRWHRGLLDVIWQNKTMLFNPRYKCVGLLSFPYYTLIEALAPIVELVGYIGFVVSLFFGVIHWKFATWFLLLAFGFPFILTYICVLIQSVTFKWYFSIGTYLKMFFCSLFEQFGYRQLSVIWRLQGFFQWMFGRETKWTPNIRKGFREGPK
jgi:cellulose synthase/poly-beta-1,6-N-acetylglucosamine synthase-like glycosyltransferase